MGPLTWLFLLAESSFKERMILWVAKWSYLGVFTFLIACGLGFPSPEEVALIGGGYAVYLNGGGWPQVWLMITVAMAGILAGDSILWAIGRKVGDHPEKVPIIGRHLNERRMKKGRALFAKHGAKAVFFGRFLFGIRAVTFFIAGSMHVPLSVFLIMDTAAGLISVPISIILAYVFGAELEQAFVWIGNLNTVILVVVGLVFLTTGYLVWKHRKTLLADDDDDLGSQLGASPDGPPAEG